MSLPDFGSLSPIGWIVLAAIVVLCAVAVYVVEDEKKKGRRVPGKMCAGCQDPGMKPVEEEEEEQGEIFL